MRHSRQGFTLIELSIVLVIIGLIVGGVLVGRDMIHTAELKSQLTKIQQLDSGIIAFKLKYGCLPGDCAFASTLFTGSENGSGNGKIEGTPYAGTPGDDYCYGITINTTIPTNCDGAPAGYKEEATLLYEHLSQSGLIPISAFIRNDVTNWQPGVQYMSIDGRLGMFALYARGRHYIDVSVVSFCGNNCPSGSGILAGGAYANLTLPETAYYFDTKVDDGKPLTGTVFTNYVFGYQPHYPVGTCVISDGAGGYNYDLSVKTLNSPPSTYGGCNVIFNASF